MFTITSQGSKVMPYITEFLADTKADLNSINTNSISPGSTCIVVEESTVYILNNKKEWKPL